MSHLEVVSRLQTLSLIGRKIETTLRLSPQLRTISYQVTMANEQNKYLRRRDNYVQVIACFVADWICLPGYFRIGRSQQSRDIRNGGTSDHSLCFFAELLHEVISRS